MKNIELFYLITKPYVNNKEIKQIVGCGINKANKIRHEIETESCSNMLLPNNKIPTEFLLKKQGIKVNKIFELAKMEQELADNKKE